MLYYFPLSSHLLIWFLSCKNVCFGPSMGAEVFIDRSYCVKWERVNCITLLSMWLDSLS